MRFSLFLSLAALAAAPISAAPIVDGDAVSVVIDMRGLDLTNETHVARLNGRIDRAATSACFDPGRTGVQAQSSFNRCRTAALDGARAKAEVAIAAATARNSSKVRLARR